MQRLLNILQRLHGSSNYLPEYAYITPVRTEQIATDGMSNSDFQPSIDTGGPVSVIGYSTADTAGRNYLGMESHITGLGSGDILRLLIDSKITVVAFHAGTGAGPHVLNQWINVGSPPVKKWLGFQDAVQNGFLPFSTTGKKLLEENTAYHAGPYPVSFGMPPPLLPRQCSPTPTTPLVLRPVNFFTLREEHSSRGCATKRQKSPLRAREMVENRQCTSRSD